jgi:hypothetical protein
MWHWPLLILVPLAHPADEHAQLLALLLLVAVAAIAYRFVEDPIRRGARLQATPRISMAGAAGAGALVVAGCVCTVLLPTYAAHQADAAARVKHAMSDLPSIGNDECFRKWG